MGFLEDLLARAFRKDSRGWLTLAPYGPRGKAYVVPPDRAREYTQVKSEFASYPNVWTPKSMKELETAALRTLPTAEDERVWAAPPSAVRTLLDLNYLLPTNGWHQIDDLMEWKFGDIGVYQFWINPVALAQGRWSAAQVTFEAH